MQHVLIVEDNEMNRDMLRRRLERRGYEVSTAVDGLDGVSAARTLRPDVVLMDLGLPRLDGWQATEVLKSEEDTSSIPIIALTGHVMESHRRRAFECGCDSFHTKPVDLEALIAAIEDCGC